MSIITCCYRNWPNYWIGLDAFRWIHNYLMDRMQYVVLGRSRSQMKPIHRGVLQGSVIGPLLYTLFTNKMMEAVKRSDCLNLTHQDRRTLFGKQCQDCGVLTLYADDYTYMVWSRSRQSNQTNIKRSLDELQKYLNDNQLVLNLPKMYLMEIMIKQKRGQTGGQPPSLTVRDDNGEDKEIVYSTYTRILGSNLQNNMLWLSHMKAGKKALLPQVCRQLRQLQHHSNQILMASRRSIVNGLVVSKMIYLMSLWVLAAEVHLRKAQILLNLAARWITCLGRWTKIRHLMQAVNWLTVKEQVRLTTVVQTWKLVHHQRPPRLLDRMHITEDLLIETQRPQLQFSTNCYRWRWRYVMIWT